MELVEAYKKILEKQSDTSVTIITVGHPHGLLLLMRDRAGSALIKQKVKGWIAMTHTGNSPEKDWNFGSNGAEVYIKELLKNWPTRVYFSGEGHEIITGNRKLHLTPVNNPVRRAYELWYKAYTTGRPSWDQLAVLFAIRSHYFKLESFGTLEQNDKLEAYWNSQSDNPNHYKIIPIKSKIELETIIEDLMSEPPSNKR